MNIEYEDLATIKMRELGIEDAETNQKIYDLLCEFHHGGYIDAIGCDLWALREEYELPKEEIQIPEITMFHQEGRKFSINWGILTDDKPFVINWRDIK